MVPLLGGPHAANGGVTDGAMASKVCHLALHCRQWTPLGVAVFSMPNGLHLDSVFLHSEDKTNEFGLVKEAVPEVAALYGCFPIKNRMYLRRNKWGSVSDPPMQYSPVDRRKNKATRVMSIMVI